METINHIDFVVSAYAAAFVVVGALIAWVMVDYRAQRRRLADLQMRGVTRRSAAVPTEQSMTQAEKKA
jgi:heme exporter protein D